MTHTSRHLLVISALLCGLLLLPAALATPGAALDPAGTEAFDTAMQAVVPDYLKIHAALAADKTDGVAQAAQAIAEKAATLDISAVTGERAEEYKALPQQIGAAAKSLAAASTLAAARDSFKELSVAMATWATAARPAGVDVVYCPMVKGKWLQKSGDVNNPYMGASMLHCGEVVAGASVPGGPAAGGHEGSDHK
ncbi:MAG: DUF3347 domain-containing protein [Candidatus Schekmanbacteria bacterium]|nr:DUF3347 domain-containing protein [Candidatus Schekmanbacteria bacterium]